MIQFESARKLLFSATGFDIGYYNPEQMKRLLSTILIKAGVKDIEEYVRFLGQDLKRIQEFKNYLTINVSEFFRDKQSFEYLQNKVLPGFYKESSRIQIWSAGCARGEEPYSLAILFEENKLRLPRYRIWATDVDDEALKRAAQGIYPENSVKNLPRSSIKKYFQEIGKDYRVNSRLRSKITFEHHDLIAPVGQGRFDLVLCRNVVIYFTVAYKIRIYQNIIGALRPGGVLSIGSTETLLNYREFGLEKLETYFYRKPFIHRKG